MTLSTNQLSDLNDKYRNKDPREIVLWASELGLKAVVTTNFRPYEVAILHLVTRVMPEIPVLWCDTGYNTDHTYRHAREVREKLRLQLHTYVPKQTVAWRQVEMGIPNIDDPRHQLFTQQVKLEPFRRAMSEHAPKIWFTNLRKGQTDHRDNLDILSYSESGILKVSPFYHWTDEALDAYLSNWSLPNEHRYWDPTKVFENRECGIHQ